MRVIYEANASSSACRLWRLSQVETGAPPAKNSIDSIGAEGRWVKGMWGGKVNWERLILSSARHVPHAKSAVHIRRQAFVRK